MITTSNKRQLASGISVIAIAAALSVATPAYAQAEFATLQGHIDGAAAGTQVIAVDTHTGQRSVGTVNAQGNYEIFGLRPSTYTVTAPGKQPQTATLQVGQAVTVDFAEARPSTAAGAIVVRGRRSAQPTQAQTVATNITPAQIENLPQSQRNFLSFAQLAPGVALISPSGAQQLQAGGAVGIHPTRTLQDRIDTLAHVRDVGIKVCCGGIIGMGESVDHRLGMLVLLANLPSHPESVPINLWNEVMGVPVNDTAERPDPIAQVRLIAVARIMMPKSVVRLSAGRQYMTDELQALCFLAGANSIFIGDVLLTTKNPQRDRDANLLERLGMTSPLGQNQVA